MSGCFFVTKEIHSFIHIYLVSTLLYVTRHHNSFCSCLAYFTVHKVHKEYSVAAAESLRVHVLYCRLSYSISLFGSTEKWLIIKKMRISETFVPLYVMRCRCHCNKHKHLRVDFHTRTVLPYVIISVRFITLVLTS